VTEANLHEEENVPVCHRRQVKVNKYKETHTYTCYSDTANTEEKGRSQDQPERRQILAETPKG
jgi:hypothetical protein